jgi:hypothetical protein
MTAVPTVTGSAETTIPASGTNVTQSGEGTGENTGSELAPVPPPPADTGGQTGTPPADPPPPPDLSNQGRGGAAEDAVPGEQNTQRIVSLTGTAKFRIPDRLTNTTITEIKNVRYQSLTGQIRDLILYAQQNHLSFKLIVGQKTRLSGPLERAVGLDNITRMPFP